MNPIEFLRSISGAFAHRLRAALTLLGMVIGTGTIVLLASLIVGGKTLLLEQNQEVNDSSVIAVQTKDAPPDMHDKATRPMTRTDGNELADSSALSGDLVATESGEERRARVGDKNKWVTTVSCGAHTLELYKLGIGKGRALDDDDQQNGHRVVVIGENVYKELFDGKELSDTLKVTFDTESFVVVGVLAHKPSMQNGQSTWSWNNKVLIPEKTYDATWGKEHQVRTIYVRGPKSTEGHEGARATVMGTLLRRHLGVLNFKLREDQSGGMEDLIMMVINVLLLSTGVLALVASGINIMNVMLVTVSERKREIGLRRAIGATPRSILVQFLLEAAALSLTGGIFGALGGTLVAWLVAVGARSSLGRWNFELPAWSYAVGLGLALVVGIVFGLAPAWRASKVSPIDALRGE